MKRRRTQPADERSPRVFVPVTYLTNPVTGEIVDSLFGKPSAVSRQPSVTNEEEDMHNDDSNQIERTWFRFSLPLPAPPKQGPHIIFIEAFVPAESEEEARTVLVENCYQNAPVASWPILGTVRRTRASFVPETNR